MHDEETLIWLPGLVCDEAVWADVRAHWSEPGLVVSYPDDRSIEAMCRPCWAGPTPRPRSRR